MSYTAFTCPPALLFSPVLLADSQEKVRVRQVQENNAHAEPPADPFAHPARQVQAGRTLLLADTATTGDRIHCCWSLLLQRLAASTT